MSDTDADTTGSDGTDDEKQKCTATCTDGSPCNSWPVQGEDKCRMHLGKSVDGSSHEDNGYAVRHNLSSERGRLYERLTDEKQREVDAIEHALIERYREFHGRDPDEADTKDLFELAMGPIQREFGREYMASQADESGNPMLEHVEMQDDGQTVEFDKPNEILDKIGDLRREDRMMKKHMGLFKDPETQQAESVETLADAVDT